MHYRFRHPAPVLDPAGKPWRFAFEELAQTLDQAKSRLAEITGAVL